VNPYTVVFLELTGLCRYLYHGEFEESKEAAVRTACLHLLADLNAIGNPYRKPSEHMKDICVAVVLEGHRKLTATERDHYLLPGNFRRIMNGPRAWDILMTIPPRGVKEWRPA